MVDAPAYSPESWHDLYVALAGAAAALTGLLFVAVSINLRQILDGPHLPRRAAETLVIMVGLLLLSVVVLVPGQPRGLLGAEIVVLGLVGVIPGVSRMRTERKAEEPWVWTWGPALTVLAFDLPILGGGVSLMAGVGGGLYWLVAAIVLGFLGAIGNAWVLLIEILR